MPCTPKRRLPLTNLSAKMLRGAAGSNLACGLCLLGRIDSMQVVLAPHIWGNSIAGQDRPVNGSALVTELTNSFGYLNSGSGYCRSDIRAGDEWCTCRLMSVCPECLVTATTLRSVQATRTLQAPQQLVVTRIPKRGPGKAAFPIAPGSPACCVYACRSGTQDCMRFPVMVGSLGSRLDDGSGTDIWTYQQLQRYMQNSGDGADGLHGSIGSYAWWQWASGASDAGGILQV